MKQAGAKAAALAIYQQRAPVRTDRPGNMKQLEQFG